jgi:hypothetical protein
LQFWQFHRQAAAVTTLHLTKLTVPAFDESLLILDLSQLKKLRCKRGMADAVGFGFIVG